MALMVSQKSTSLFSMPLGDAGKFEELWTHSFLATTRSQLDQLFLENEPFLDKNFCKKFAKEPLQRFWEMFLCARLRRAGKNVIPRSKRIGEVGPDFLIEENGENIWIEAVTFGPGSDENPDSVYEIGSEVRWTPDDQIDLRISGAIKAKAEKFNGYLEKGLIAQSDAKVIAVSPAQVQTWDIPECAPAIARVLYPLGVALIADRESPDAMGIRHAHRDQLQRQNGTEIEMSLFSRSDYTHISAAFWSKSNIYSPTSPQDMQVFLNHRSDSALAEKWIDAELECTPIYKAGGRFELNCTRGKEVSETHHG